MRNNLLGARAVDRLAVHGACREMESRARPRPAGSCRPAQGWGWGVKCHSPELGLNYLWRGPRCQQETRPVGGYRCVGWRRARSRSVTTPRPFFPLEGAVLYRCEPWDRRGSCPHSVLVLGIGLAIWAKVISVQRHLILVLLPRVNVS